MVITTPAQSSRSLWLMLTARTGLFVLWQAILALVLLILGSLKAWDDAAAWWPITVILTNLVCIVLLQTFYQREGLRFWDIFRLKRETWRKDLLFLVGILVISGPVAMLPNMLLATWLFGDQQVALDLFLRPLPTWAIFLAVTVWPVTQALAELPFYFAYLMPRLEAQTGQRWQAVLLSAFWLGAQHCAMPLVFDGRFILWRFWMFLPFALMVAVVLRSRPQLLPYLVVVHGLMDMATALMIPVLG